MFLFLQSLEILYNYDNSLMELKTKKEKRSVLHLAVKSRSVVAVRFVFRNGLDLVNSVDSMLQTPVHYAAGLKRPSILEYFISKGGNVTTV